MILTKDEIAFFARVADYIVKNPGTKIVEACKAILKRDEELYLKATAKTEEGDAIRHAMCAVIYRQARKQAA